MQKKKHAQTTIGEQDKTVLDITLQRDTEENRLIMEVEASEELESTLKEFNGRESTSSSWQTPNGENIIFYKRTTGVPKGYTSIMSDYKNDFGAALYDNAQKYNVAILRAKNLSEGITVALPNRLSVEDAKNLVKNLEQCAGRIYKQFCKPFVLESSLTERKVM